MSTTETPWFRVPEVWLMIVLLAAVVVGSLAFVATAMRQNDQLHGTIPARVASPLPPSAARPADETTP